MRFPAAWMAVVAVTIAGCATTAGRDIRVDYDDSADLGSYRTYGFPEEVGTDRAGYSTILTPLLQGRGQPRDAAPRFRL